MGTRIRPLSGAERQLWLLSRTSPFQIVLALELPAGVPAPDEDALRAALEKVRGRHPLLRVRVAVAVRGQTLVFEECDSPIPLRLVRGAPDLTAVIEEELNLPVPTDTGPLLRAVLVTPDEGRAAVLLTFDHTAADGISVSAVFREVLAALSRQEDAQADETVRPATPQNVAPSIAGLPRTVRRPWFWLRFLGRRLAELWWRIRHGAIRSIPHRSVPAAEQRSRIIRYEFAPEDVATLRGRAATEGVSLHAVLCAAQLLAIRGLFSGDGPLPLAAYSPTDLRSRLEFGALPRVPPDHMGQYVGYARSMHRVRPNAGLWDLAREVRDQITTRVAASDDLGYNVLGHVLMRVLARWFRPDDKGAARLSRAAAGSMSHTTVMTNLGEVASADTLEGASLHVAMNNLPGSVFVSGAVRLSGRLGWSFAWAEPCLDAATARTLADAAIAQLRGALR